MKHPGLGACARALDPQARGAGLRLAVIPLRRQEATQIAPRHTPWAPIFGTWRPARPTPIQTHRRARR